MQKFSINYARSFPDHRVPVDYTYNRELMKGPSSYFKQHKHAFNIAGVKHFPIYFCIFSTVLFTAVGCYKYWNHDGLTSGALMKTSMPAFKYALLSMRGGYGAYDNVLNKFEGEIGGLLDLPFDE